MSHLIVSCSLSARSRSAQMSDHLVKAIRTRGAEAELVDLRLVELPLCDGGDAYEHPNAQVVADQIEAADSVTLAVPIYNYDVGGAARNLIAMTGKVWTEKVVGFIGAAGGERSHMAIMGLASSLMLDFRSIIVPRYLYAAKSVYPGGPPNDVVAKRIDFLASDLIRFANAFNAMEPAEL